MTIQLQFREEKEDEVVKYWKNRLAFSQVENLCEASERKRKWMAGRLQRGSFCHPLGLSAPFNEGLFE